MYFRCSCEFVVCVDWDTRALEKQEQYRLSPGADGPEDVWVA